MALDELKENEDTININGIDMLISDEVKPVASLNIIDYVESAEGVGFIIGPKSGETCC